MSNGVALVSSATPPAIPQSMLEQYNAMALSMSEGFSASLNFIRPGKMNFKLIEGGVAREVDNGQVVGVLLGIAPHDYCTWYEKQYVPGQEPETPDLVWEWPNQNVFPDALPQELRRKQMINGKERWAFRVARRSVWALANRTNSGQIALNLQSPYILDITSMSMFGKSTPDTNTYKFSGLMGLCQRLSQPPHFICSPSMFLTQILIDAAASVSGVVVFRPAFTQGQPQYLDNDTFQQVLQLMMSQQVQDMLKVREKLTRETGVSPVPPQPSMPNMPPVSPVQPQQAAQPMTPPPPVGGVYNQAPNNVPPQPQPVQQPVAQPTPVAPSEDLLAQAEAILAQQAAPQPPQAGGIPVAPGVNPTTADAVNALNGMLL